MPIGSILACDGIAVQETCAIIELRAASRLRIMARKVHSSENPFGGITTISMRRFRARPMGVPFVSIGR